MSQLGRHQSALEHAQNALILLQEELLTPPGSSTSKAAPQADRIAVLAIAYHNIGVEQEFLKRYEQSILSYRKGVEVAERYLGPKHAIAITLKNSLIAAKKVVAAKGSRGDKLDEKLSKTNGATGALSKTTAGQSKAEAKRSYELDVQDKYETDQLAEMTSELMLDTKVSAIPPKSGDRK